MDVICEKCAWLVEFPEQAKGPLPFPPCPKCGGVMRAWKTEKEKPEEKEDKALDMFEKIKQLLPEISRIIQEFRRSKISGADTGIGEAVARMSRELSLEVIQEDPLIREGLKDLVREELRAAFLPKEEEEGGEEVES